MPQPLTQVVPLLQLVIVTEWYMRDYIGELLRRPLHPYQKRSSLKFPEEAIKICKVANGLDEDADEEIVIDVAELEPKTLWRLNLVCDRAKDEQT